MRRFVLALLIAAAPLLFGCASKGTPPEAEVRIVEVLKPVMVTCAAKEPKTKPYPDTDAALQAAKNIFDQVKLLMAGRTLRPANEAILRAAREGCEGVALGGTIPPR